MVGNMNDKKKLIYLNLLMIILGGIVGLVLLTKTDVTRNVTFADSSYKIFLKDIVKSNTTVFIVIIFCSILKEKRAIFLIAGVNSVNLGILLSVIHSEYLFLILPHGFFEIILFFYIEVNAFEMIESYRIREHIILFAKYYVYLINIAFIESQITTRLALYLINGGN